MKIKGCGNSKYNSYDLPEHGKTIPLETTSLPSFKERNRNCQDIADMVAKERAKFEKIRYP